VEATKAIEATTQMQSGTTWTRTRVRPFWLKTFGSALRGSACGAQEDIIQVFHGSMGVS
jgi:hypothetical protein